MKPLKTKVSITLDEDVTDQIKELAEMDDRSFSQYVNMVLKDWANKEMHNNRYISYKPQSKKQLK